MLKTFFIFLNTLEIYDFNQIPKFILLVHLCFRTCVLWLQTPHDGSQVVSSYRENDGNMSVR